MKAKLIIKTYLKNPPVGHQGFVSREIAADFQSEEALTAKAIEMLGTFATAGIAERKDDKTIRYFGPFEISHVECERQDILIASPYEAQQAVANAGKLVTG